MTNADISRRLALAIGWSDADPEDPDVVIFRATLFGQYLEDHCAVWFEQEWRTFDYRDPAVIWPIAERYKCFPQANLFDSGWHAITQNDWDEGLDQSTADTAEKAVALAVIRHHEWR